MEAVMLILSVLNASIVSGYLKAIRLRLTVALCAGVIWAGMAQAMAQTNEVWVDNDYCNGCSNDGHAWGIDAFNTIQDGVNAADMPGSVNVLPGTYPENITLRAGLTLRGAGRESTIVDGGGNGSVVTVGGVGTIAALEGLTIKNGTGTLRDDGYTYGGGLYISNSTLVLRDCVVTGNRATNGAGGLEAYGSTVTVLDSDISYNTGWWGGAVALHESNAQISGSIFENNAFGYGGCIFLEDASQTNIVNSRIARNTLGVGIGKSSTATVSNSTLTKNHSGIATGTQMVSNQTGSAVVKNCILWSNGDDLSGELDHFTVTFTDTQFGWPGEGNISSDPLFVDPENTDYRLKDYSPCIGAGSPDGAPDDDIEGNSRPAPAGTDPDLGAYENTLGFPGARPADWSLSPVRLTNTIATPDMAVSDEGRVVVVWADTSNPYAEDGLYCAVKSPGGNWSKEELAHAGWWIEDPHVAFDGEETIHVVWQGRMGDGTAGILYASKPKQGAWSAPVEISDGPSISPALAVDAENAVHAVWVQASDIFYAFKPSGGSWETPVVNLSGSPATASSEPDIAVGAGGTVWAAWAGDNPGGILCVSKGSGEGWSEPATLSASGSSPEINAGLDGAVVAVWKNTGVFYSVRSPGKDWSDPVAIPVTGLYFPNLVIDAQRDIVHVVEIRGGGIYHLYSCKGSMWFSELLFPVDWVSDSSSSTALGSDGRLHISWFRREWTSHGVWVGEYLPPPDTDGDCLSDETEVQSGADANDLDTDDDGVSDGEEDANHNGDADGDETDPLKPDTDDDGIRDGVELGIVVLLADPDGEGPLLGTDAALFRPDFDPATATDPLNPDTDGDGVADGAEDLNHNGRFDPGETDPDWKPLDIFGMALGNKWTYEGTRDGLPLIVEREVAAIDAHTYPVPTYVVSISENGVFVAMEWYENTAGRINLRGVASQDEGVLPHLRFSNGLPMAWSPMAANDHEYASTTAVIDEAPGYTYTVSLDVKVDGMEAVTLGFDTVDAYRVKNTLHMSGYHLNETDTFDWWMAPYIGVVKDQDAQSTVKLTSFAIGGGAITEQSDADADGLSDYKEIFVYNTHWKSQDTDSDTCKDSQEITGGRNPLSLDPQGDLNADCALDLKDAVYALRIITLTSGPSAIDTRADANGDGKIAIEDALFVLQKISGQR